LEVAEARDGMRGLRAPKGKIHAPRVAHVHRPALRVALHPDRAYHPGMKPSRPWQTYEGREVTVTFDRARCIHSEECVRGLPAVFDPGRRGWIRPDEAAPAAVLEVVARCPSGALRAYRAGEPAVQTSAAETVVTVSHGGPLLLRGNLRIVDEAGETIATGEAAALCRCGGTANPPFCDGTHTRIGFCAKGRPPSGGAGESGATVPA
jgi:uncharacterized Fe-S cluster protein YjdI/CDGSH-type Zn-finger protein